MNTLTRPDVAADRPSMFAQLTILSVVLLALAILWGQFDTRSLNGVPVWHKPAKFALSFIVHFATLAIIVAALSEHNRTCRTIVVAGGVMAAAFAAEMFYIYFQAAQAENSHFNYSTSFHETMYNLMGVGAILLICTPIAVAWVARCDMTIGAASRAGIWWGALTSFFLTTITAVYLSSQGGHLVGIPDDPSRVLPVVGWSTEVGDLRPAHFLSLHALQVLPLVGLWIDRQGHSLSIIKPFAAVYALMSLAVLGQALLGLPLIPL
ncbi:MAG: hypothetical protein AB8B64_00895 [Granulosicoccus sp.]